MTFLFDLGGVVLHGGEPNTSKSNARAFERAFGAPQGAFSDLPKVWNQNWADFKLGKITESEFWQRYLSAAGARKVDVEKAKTLFRNLSAVDKQMLALVKELKKKNPVAALTNIGKEWHEFNLKAFKLNEYFDPIITSYEMGLAKPEKAAFEKALAILDAGPRDVVFIDNSAWNIEPAREIGMRAILFERAEKLGKDLELVKS